MPTTIKLFQPKAKRELDTIEGKLKRARLKGTSLVMFIDEDYGPELPPTEVHMAGGWQSTFTFFALRGGDMISCNCYETKAGHWAIPSGQGIAFCNLTDAEYRLRELRANQLAAEHRREVEEAKLHYIYGNK